MRDITNPKDFAIAPIEDQFAGLRWLWHKIRKPRPQTRKERATTQLLTPDEWADFKCRELRLHWSNPLTQENWLRMQNGLEPIEPEVPVKAMIAGAPADAMFCAAFDAAIRDLAFYSVEAAIESEPCGAIETGEAQRILTDLKKRLFGFGYGAARESIQ